jgi:GT2 family glycosyltransferase
MPSTNVTGSDLGAGPSASVVIPVHDGALVLGDQLDALARQEGAPTFEVVVVLNRCTDASGAIASRHAGTLPLTIVEADDRASVGYARNVGARTATGPVLLFCDADDCVGPVWVAKMTAALVGTTNDFVGGRIVIDRTSVPDWIYRHRYKYFDGECLVPLGEALAFPIGASFGCTREAFDVVGGFDELFPGAGSDESDLAVRLFRSGHRVAEAPEAWFSYRPRTTLRGCVQQARGYARGAATAKAKEGTLAPATRLGVARQVARTLGFLVLRSREWRLRVLLLRSLVRFHYAEQERELAARLGIARPPQATTEDLLVPPRTPIVGGLAFEAERGQASWHATHGVGLCSISLLDALLPDAGTFVDVGAGIGVVTVAAALTVGPAGRVVAVEPAEISCEHLRRNIGRHRVAERVDVHQQVALGEVVDGPVDVIRVAIGSDDPGLLRSAASLLEASPDVALLVELGPGQHQFDATSASGLTDLVHLLEQLTREPWAAWAVDEHRAAAGAPVCPIDDSTRGNPASAPRGERGTVLATRWHRRSHVQDVVGALYAVEVHRSAPRGLPKAASEGGA